MLEQSYYWLDLFIGFGLPIVILMLYKTNRISLYIWKLFWIGVLLGLFWELPIFVLSKVSNTSIIIWVRELPLHYAFFLASHSLWDGGIFLLGVLIVYLLKKDQYFTKFNWVELIIFIVYGQVSALLVELSSVTNDGWVYVNRYDWNPALFYYNHRPITLLPQVIWLTAPVIYYFIAVRMKITYSVTKLSSPP